MLAALIGLAQFSLPGNTKESERILWSLIETQKCAKYIIHKGDAPLRKKKGKKCDKFPNREGGGGLNFYFLSHYNSLLLVGLLGTIIPKTMLLTW